ncbi:hypothetical protein LKK83_00850, partial [Phormidium sp. CCY1219]|nr:hypothetical protein [Phormidium sp. CCY1219]
PTISPTLAGILDRAIKSHPRDRFSSAREMLDAIAAPAYTAAAPPTFASPPPTRAHQPPTAVSLPTTSLSSPSAPPSKEPQGMGNWQKAAIMGGVVGAILIAASGIGSFFFSDRYQTMILNPPNNQQQQRRNISNQALGWMRIGSVDNTNDTASVGEPLIPTNQPVIISPPVVPAIGDKVIVSNGVNLRQNHPQPPYYELEEKISVLMPGQEVVILKVATFVDPYSPSPETKVWAEVGLP